jgi:hypothetical protein
VIYAKLAGVGFRASTQPTKLPRTVKIPEIATIFVGAFQTCPYNLGLALLEGETDSIAPTSFSNSKTSSIDRNGSARSAFSTTIPSGRLAKYSATAWVKAARSFTEQHLLVFVEAHEQRMPFGTK